MLSNVGYIRLAKPKLEWWSEKMILSYIITFARGHQGKANIILELYANTYTVSTVRMKSIKLLAPVTKTSSSQ